MENRYILSPPAPHDPLEGVVGTEGGRAGAAVFALILLLS
jgi:hypothetical protein